MFRIGIDNYGLFPLQLTPLETLQWALDHGAGGVAFSGLDEAVRYRLDCRQLERLKVFTHHHNLYLEWGGAQHIPRNMATWEKKDLFNHNRIAAEEAEALGVRIVRSCSGGLMRWNSANPPTSQLLEEMTEALAAQKKMLVDHNVILAIETHFEFTTFELLKVFNDLGALPGEWLGICLDTMNLLTMLEDPVSATARVLPWVVSTHIKDGGLEITDPGFRSFPASFGEGVIDFDAIFELLSRKDSPSGLPNPDNPDNPDDLDTHDNIVNPEHLKPLNLNIEDHGGSFDIPIFDPDFRKEFPDLDDPGMEKLVMLAEQTKVRMEAGTLKILERSEWPKVCESRMIHNLNALKNKVYLQA